jgi:hypothetical protein
MIPFIGYAPDVETQTNGVITACDGFYPTERGMRSTPTGANAVYSAFPLAIVGMSAIRYLDGTGTTFVGTSAKLYQLGTSSASDVSKGGGYALGASDRWSFAQFGDTTIAAAKTETLQSAAKGGNFADISGAPKGKLVTSASGFVMIADVNDTTLGDQSDRWWCSAYLDSTSWTPSTATQATTGRLIDSPGPITALKALGDNVVVYKERAMWVGAYTGGDATWEFQRLPGDVGARSNESVVSVEYSHFFVGTDDFYMFDGTRAVSIGTPIRKTFFRDLVSSEFAYKIIGSYDRVNGTVWWFYPSKSSTVLDKAVIYHIKTGRWGAASISVEYASEYLAGGTTYEGIGSLYSTYNDLPTTILYDSEFFTSRFPQILVANTSHVLQSLTGTPGTSTLTTGNYGDDDQYSMIDYVRPRFTIAPASASCVAYSDDDNGDAFQVADQSDLIDNKFDLRVTSHWHRFAITTNGDAEIIGLSVKAGSAGER